MSDWADEACAMEGLYLQEALSRRNEVKIARNGACHNCEEPTEQLFCSPECHQDWELRERIG